MREHRGGIRTDIGRRQGRVRPPRPPAEDAPAKRAYGNDRRARLVPPDGGQQRLHLGRRFRCGDDDEKAAHHLYTQPGFEDDLPEGDVRTHLAEENGRA